MASGSDGSSVTVDFKGSHTVLHLPKNVKIRDAIVKAAEAFQVEPEGLSFLYDGVELDDDIFIEEALGKAGNGSVIHLIRTLKNESTLTKKKLMNDGDKGAMDSGRDLPLMEPIVTFSKVRQIGAGAYGSVYVCRYGDLLCAAKIMHLTLFQFDHTGKPPPLLQRFEEECKVMREIRHPCIVQFLNRVTDPDSGLPILLMELMEESLTNYLEKLHGPPLCHVQVNICQDICMGLSYLHSINLIHRDISSNNVLLTDTNGPRAKISDFGVSILMSTGLNAMTVCPGSLVYMPPEGRTSTLKYSEKMDIFSFGVIGVQIATGLFPNPGDHLVSVNDDSIPNQFLMLVPEVERRQNHICQIADGHHLKKPFLSCLENDPKKRPSAHELCEQFLKVKESTAYVESIQCVRLQDSSKLLTERDALARRLDKMNDEQKRLQDTARNNQEETQRLSLLLNQEMQRITRLQNENERLRDQRTISQPSSWISRNIFRRSQVQGAETFKLAEEELKKAKEDAIDERDVAVSDAQAARQELLNIKDQLEWSELRQEEKESQYQGAINKYDELEKEFHIKCNLLQETRNTIRQKGEKFERTIKKLSEKVHEQEGALKEKELQLAREPSHGAMRSVDDQRSLESFLGTNYDTKDDQIKRLKEQLAEKERELQANNDHCAELEIAVSSYESIKDIVLKGSSKSISMATKLISGDCEEHSNQLSSLPSERMSLNDTDFPLNMSPSTSIALNSLFPSVSLKPEEPLSPKAIQISVEDDLESKSKTLSDNNLLSEVTEPESETMKAHLSYAEVELSQTQSTTLIASDLQRASDCEVHTEPQPLEYSQQPQPHSQQPQLHSQQPQLWEYSQQPQLHSQQPQLHSQQPQLHSQQQPQPHNQQPQLHSQQPQLREYSQQPQLHGQQPQLHSQQPQPHSQQPRPHSQQPQPHSQQPQPHSQQPQPHSQQPQPHSQQPQPHSQQPQPHSQQPQPHSQQPQPHSLQPQPREYSQQSQPHGQQPQLHSQQPQLHSLQPQPREYSQQSQPHSQQPQPHSQQPQPHSQQPQLHSLQPQPHSQQPQLHSLQPQPQEYSQQSQPYSQQPQLHSQQPQLYSQQPQLHSQQPQPWECSQEPQARELFNQQRSIHYSISVPADSCQEHIIDERSNRSLPTSLPQYDDHSPSKLTSSEQYTLRQSSVQYDPYSDRHLLTPSYGDMYDPHHYRRTAPVHPTNYIWNENERQHNGTSSPHPPLRSHSMSGQIEPDYHRKCSHTAPYRLIVDHRHKHLKPEHRQDYHSPITESPHFMYSQPISNVFRQPFKESIDDAVGYEPSACIQTDDRILVDTLQSSECKPDEYLAVLMQQQHVEDSLSPWKVVFSVCLRNPCCIEPLQKLLRDSFMEQFEVASFCVKIKEDNDGVILIIPKEEIQQQGYSVSSDVHPCKITRSDMSPPWDMYQGRRVTPAYPPRRTLTIKPRQCSPSRQDLQVHLKLEGIEKCDDPRRFILRSPSLIASPKKIEPHQNPHSQGLQLQRSSLGPLDESVCQAEPDKELIIKVIAHEMYLKWSEFGIALGVPFTELKKIGSELLHTAIRYNGICEVTEYWFRHTTDPNKRTWQTIFNALVSLEEQELVQQLKQEAIKSAIK